MISADRLTDLFVEVADTLVTDFDLVDFLHKLTDHAAAVSGAEAVGLMLADHHGKLRYMASSNETGKMFELLQLQNSEGPCLDCFSTRKPVVNADLASASDRWPHFAPAAIAAGFQSVHAFPMRLRDEAIGALDLFGRDDVEFIEQAKGALAQMEGTTATDTFELMRSQARSSRRRFVDVAAEVLDQIAGGP